MIRTAMRLRGLLVKEVTQVRRDPSSLLIAFLLPLILLLINGFSITLDARAVRLAVVIDAPSAPTQELFQAMAASPYLAPIRVATTEDGARLIANGTARGMLVLREDFAETLLRPQRWPAHVGLQVSGTDPNTARLVEGYVAGALQTWFSSHALENRNCSPGGR